MEGTTDGGWGQHPLPMAAASGVGQQEPTTTRQWMAKERDGHGQARRPRGAQSVDGHRRKSRLDGCRLAGLCHQGGDGEPTRKAAGQHARPHTPGGGPSWVP